MERMNEDMELRKINKNSQNFQYFVPFSGAELLSFGNNRDRATGNAMMATLSNSQSPL